jgi:hypothetical protein
MKVVIAGSRKLPEGKAPFMLIRFLGALPDDAVVMLRTPYSIGKLPGLFEKDVDALCDALNIPVEWCAPEPTILSPGRVSVYIRDIDMVAKADLVLLFFTNEDSLYGYSGTTHLMDKALDQNIPMYAYRVEKYGRVERVGEHDPENAFGEMVPAAS